MDEPNHSNLFIPKQIKSVRSQVVYIHPPQTVIDQYASHVCQVWSDKYGDRCMDTEFVQGFRMFVRSVVKAQVHQLNKREGVPHGIKKI